MKNQISQHNNNGGDPKKAIKKDSHITVKCSVIEKTIIQQKAKTLNLSLSEYLRESGLKGQIVTKIKSLPKEVLLLTASLNHMAANLNQLAKKRNQFDVLDAFERAELNSLSSSLKDLTEKIKSWLK